MFDLKKFVENQTDSDVINAFYYVARYLKQAEHILKEYKDIFEDEDRSSPSIEVRKLANLIISKIENDEGMSVLHLEDTKCMAWISLITEVEQSIGPEFTPEEIEVGSKVLRNLEDPKLVFTK